MTLITDEEVESAAYLVKEMPHSFMYRILEAYKDQKHTNEELQKIMAAKEEDLQAAFKFWTMRLVEKDKGIERLRGVSRNPKDVEEIERLRHALEQIEIRSFNTHLNPRHIGILAREALK